MYATLVYNGSAVGVNASNTDLNAATDPDFSQRNNHYIFTEDYRLLSAALVGASVTRGRFQVPHWNALGEFILFNANRSLQAPSNPQWDDYRFHSLLIPRNEEFQCQSSNNLGSSTEIENVVLNIGTADWNMNIDRGVSFPGMNGGGLFWVRTSFTLTPTLNAWSGPVALTFSQALRGGVYALNHAIVQGTNAVAWRAIFPRAKLYMGGRGGITGRKMRPGGLIQNAIGDNISNNTPPWMSPFGFLGRFHTFEPVQFEVFGTLAGSITYQAFLGLTYIGEDEDLLAY